jgi:hypothetical protein
VPTEEGEPFRAEPFLIDARQPAYGQPVSTQSRRRFVRAAGTVPALYAVMARSVTVPQRIRTVAVTAVGMFAGGGGFGITPLTLMSLEVVVGGMT